MHRHIGCICLVFLHCAFSNVFSKRWYGQLQNYIGCICLTFLDCAFSNVSSNGLLEKMPCRTGCICLIFLHSAFSDVSLSCLLERMQNHTGCICLIFLRCAFSNESSKRLHKRMHNYTGCICLIFPYVHWQPSHWSSSARNYHFQDFVPSQPGDKVCPLLLLVLNWESSNVELKKQENESEIIQINCRNKYKIQ